MDSPQYNIHNGPSRQYETHVVPGYVPRKRDCAYLYCMDLLPCVAITIYYKSIYKAQYTASKQASALCVHSGAALAQRHVNGCISDIRAAFVVPVPVLVRVRLRLRHRPPHHPRTNYGTILQYYPPCASSSFSCASSIYTNLLGCAPLL